MIKLYHYIYLSSITIDNGFGLVSGTPCRRRRRVDVSSVNGNQRLKTKKPDKVLFYSHANPTILTNFTRRNAVWPVRPYFGLMPLPLKITCSMHGTSWRTLIILFVVPQSTHRDRWCRIVTYGVKLLWLMISFWVSVVCCVLYFSVFFVLLPC